MCERGAGRRRFETGRRASSGPPALLSMSLRKRRAVYNGRTRRSAADGPYIHSSPPRVVNSVSSALVRQLLRSGDLDKLEQLVIDGQGARLVGEYSADYKTRTFLKQVPGMMSKIALLHDAVTAGSLAELQALLSDGADCGRRKRLSMSKDAAGVGLLHKAVYYDLPEIYTWLAETHPLTVTVKDSAGRTPMHYVAMCRDVTGAQKLLTAAGADLHALDLHGHTYRHYVEHPNELELPSLHRPRARDQIDSGKQKQQWQQQQLAVKPANIRIWIHQRDLGRLQKVLWDGHGAKLRTQTCNHPRIKRFLEAVPHLMGVVRDIHSAAVNDDIDVLRERTAPPVRPIVLSSRDSTGMTPLHKAAGLGHRRCVEHIIATYPAALQLSDAEGRTPLHFAATLRDGEDMYNLLVDAGADEATLDNKQKAAAYYRSRPNELDVRGLRTVPDAPRTSSAAFPPSWDWSLLDSPTSAPTDDSKRIKKAEEPFGSTPVEENKPIEQLLNEDKPEEKPPEEIQPALRNGTSSPEPVEVDEPSQNIDDPSQDIDIVSQDIDDSQIITDSQNINDTEDINDSQLIDDSQAIDDTQAIDDSLLNDEPLDNKIDSPIPSPEVPLELTQAPPDVLAIESEGEEDPVVVESSAPDDQPEENLVVNGVEEVGVIEGVVNGEAEAETLNEDQNGGIDIAAMVESGNMEQLASIVLNGDGEQLVGKQSDNPEIQAFLDNVPIYMSKINRIHVAAREGDLRELQAALDRRKFAIARDPISPNGASPLHLAVVFGRTSVVRYLAGRFPETIQTTDDNGRTPLHYAATLPDNGHYYNLLVHLGADASAKDNFGRDAAFYMTDQRELTHRQLLKEFGADDGQADEMLNDKDIRAIDLENKPGSGQVEIPLFKTEEGRYLASSLGDPLIKGLTEVANKRPEDPIAYLATYLYNFANSSKGEGNGTRRPPRSAAGSRPGQPVDVVAVDTKENDDVGDPMDAAGSAAARDEHGQSMLHFAAARRQSRGALFQLLQEADINLGYRDELYRTARDVSVQAGQPDNTRDIDRYVVTLAVDGDTDRLVELLLEGYDHIIDTVDDDNTPILQAVERRGSEQPTVTFLHSILAFEERRERVHHAIRQGRLEDVQQMLADEKDTGSGKLLAIAKNSYGRCTLHIAVLCQQEEIVDYIVGAFPDTLHVGDNLERTALHYAMGVDKVERLSRLLVEAGAKRALKDLKGRQPSYYFMNKSDVLRLQEEEETF